MASTTRLFLPSKYNREIKLFKMEVERLLMEIIQSRRDYVEIGKSGSYENDLLGMVLNEMQKKEDGLGDAIAIRVSLTEPPEEEIDSCRKLANLGMMASKIQLGWIFFGSGWCLQQQLWFKLVLMLLFFHDQMLPYPIMSYAWFQLLSGGWFIPVDSNLFRHTGYETEISHRAYSLFGAKRHAKANEQVLPTVIKDGFSFDALWGEHNQLIGWHFRIFKC